jgi:hypothetical protein
MEVKTWMGRASKNSWAMKKGELWGVDGGREERSESQCIRMGCVCFDREV